MIWKIRISVGGCCGCWFVENTNRCIFLVAQGGNDLKVQGDDMDFWGDDFLDE